MHCEDKDFNVQLGFDRCQLLDLRYVIIIVVAIVGVGATVGVVYSYNQMSYRPCEGVKQVAGDDDYNANRAYALMVTYPDLKSLVKASDAIIVGKIVDCIGIRDYASVPFTYFHVATERIVKESGEAKASVGDKIVIQLLMVSEDADYHINVGERYVFFLGYSDVKKVYAPLGPQSRFLVDYQNLVHSLDDYYSDVHITVKENGKPLDDFISEIERAGT
jgi:hypothetical protein